MGTSYIQNARATGLQPAPECSSETFSETTVVNGDEVGTKDGQDTLKHAQGFSEGHREYCRGYQRYYVGEWCSQVWHGWK